MHACAGVQRGCVPQPLKALPTLANQNGWSKFGFNLGQASQCAALCCHGWSLRWQLSFSDSAYSCPSCADLHCGTDLKQQGWQSLHAFMVCLHWPHPPPSCAAAPQFGSSYSGFSGCGGAGSWDAAWLEFRSLAPGMQTMCLDLVRLLP